MKCSSDSHLLLLVVVIMDYMIVFPLYRHKLEVLVVTVCDLYKGVICIQNY